MKRTELQIIRRLRENARETLTRMSRHTGIPVSTIYEKLKAFEKTTILKHTCLLDFRAFGYDLRITLLIATKPGKKQEIIHFLTHHHQINTVHRINNGYDFLVDAVFTNMSDLQQFLDALDNKPIKTRKEYYILEEIQREAFLTTDTHVSLLKPKMQS